MGRNIARCGGPVQMGLSYSREQAGPTAPTVTLFYDSFGSREVYTAFAIIADERRDGPVRFARINLVKEPLNGAPDVVPALVCQHPTRQQARQRRKGA